jgi:hypothetical protein
MSFALVLVSMLMFTGIRPIRRRWLRSGFILRPFVFKSIALAIAPQITVGSMGFLGVVLWSGRRGRVCLGRTVR